MSFVITCRCGKNKQAFKNNIGDFYVDECCKEAGYDEFGNLSGTSTDVPQTDGTTLSSGNEEAPKPKLQPLAICKGCGKRNHSCECKDKKDGK